MNICLFIVSNDHNRKNGNICLNLTIKASEQRQHCSSVCIVNFEQISHITHISCVSAVGSAHTHLFAKFDPDVCWS